jgi:dienelactone hydrolase
LSFCLVLVGCLHLAVPGTGQALSSPDADALSSPRQASAAEPNGATWSVEQGSVSSATGCDLHYRLYRPTRAWSDGLVVLGHGFLRSQDRMVDLARALAAAGVKVVTLDFCNSRWWDGRHFRNGLDMIRVADAVDAERVIYAGFSAGALAALVAGRNDRRTLGVVALDLVDAQRLGEGIVASLEPPLIGLVGDPSPCNAENNGLAVFAANPRASVEWVAGADHCDFESPTDWICRLVCAGQRIEQHSPRRDIIDATLSAVVSLLLDQPPVARGEDRSPIGSSISDVETADRIRGVQDARHAARSG